MDFIKLVSVVVEMLVGSLSLNMHEGCVNIELFAVDMYRLICDARMHGYKPMDTAIGICMECGLPHPFFRKDGEDKAVSACKCGHRRKVEVQEIDIDMLIAVKKHMFNDDMWKQTVN